MAKLSARGRTEIWRAKKEGRPESSDLHWQRTSVALTSDGIILQKIDIRSTSIADIDHGQWKVLGKIKPDMTAERALEIYAKKGFSVESASGLPSFDLSYFKALAAAAAAKAPLPESPYKNGGTVLRTQAQADKAAKAKEKAQAKRDAENGPGYYVRRKDGTPTRAMFGEFWAPIGPYETWPEATRTAEQAFSETIANKKTVLFPIQIVKVDSRDQAKRNGPVVMWEKTLK